MTVWDLSQGPLAATMYLGSMREAEGGSMHSCMRKKNASGKRSRPNEWLCAKRAVCAKKKDVFFSGWHF